MAEAQDIPPRYRLRRTRGIATVRDVADWLSWLGARMQKSFKVEIEGAKRSSYKSDGMTHFVFDEDHDWVYVVNAQIVASPNTALSLPADTGLFVAGVESGGFMANQSDFQTWSQVREQPGSSTSRRITVTLYASSLLPPATDASLGEYRGDIGLTIEFVGPSGVYDTFNVTATEAGYSFPMDAPTPDETYYLRFINAAAAVTLPVTTVVTSNGGEDVFLSPANKPFRLPAGGLLHAEKLTALIKWVEGSLVYKPPNKELDRVSDTAQTRKSTPVKPTYKLNRKGGFAYVSDARDFIKWLAKRMVEKV